MFPWTRRKKAVEAAVAALRPVIATAQMSGGMSTSIYYDPYVVGYLSFLASFFAKAETNNKASSTDVGIAMQTAFTNVCNVNGEEMAKYAVELIERNDEGYFQGSNDASVACFYNAGLINESSDIELVREAVKFADAMGGSMLGGSREAAIGGALMQLSFNERLRALRGANA